MTKRSIPIPHGEHLAARGLQINVDEALRDRLRSKFMEKGTGRLLVGIAWRGARNVAAKPYTINILEWGPILHVPGVTFVNLQPGECRKELAAAIQGFGVSIQHKEILDPRKKTNGYAARIAALDIVIAPDSDAAAIATAFDIPVLCIAPPLGASDLGARPNTLVFTQRHAGQWLDIIRDVGLALLDRAIHAGAVEKRAPYLRTLAQAFANMGRLGDAEYLYRQLAQESGFAAEGLHQIASLKQRAGQDEEALGLFDEALVADPAFLHAYNGKALTLAALHRFEEAVAVYRKGLEVNPESGEIHNNLGTSLRSLGRAAEALPHYRQAMKFLPDVASVQLNDASALDESGEAEQALQVFGELIAKHPDYVDAHYNRSQILLSLGRLEEGWKESVWRLKRPAANARHDIFPQPVWQSENLAGKNILVWTEQGIGDELLTASMVPDAINIAKHVTLLCSERLLPLMRRSFPNATIAHRAEPLPDCATDPSIDFQMSLSELGMALRREFADFQNNKRFLKEDQNRRDALRAKYQAQRPGSKVVGISWMSQKNYEIGWLKSQNLLSWKSILSTPDITFVNLQYGDRSEDLKNVKEHLGVEVYHDGEIDPLVDMDAFAAQVAAMDLVISVSNTTVHTAGALGIPTWVLAAKGRGRLWYWFRGKESSPWYPSVRLISQETEGDWIPVLDRCATDLATWSLDGAKSP
jgi:tetratricopeptide (TPR) repeat protein